MDDARRDDRPYAAVTLAAAALFGTLVFAVGAGMELADPTRIEWALNGDWSNHFLGWHLYRHGPWSWPLGATPLLAHPVGSSIGLTDSIPLLAVFFKALHPLLPADFQYLGAWLLVCFALQGLYGARLMQLVSNRPAIQMLGAALFVLSPALLFRLPHPALASHWLLLAALHRYFADQPGTGAGRFACGWMAVACLSAALHPYLAFMTLAIMAAAYARRLLVARHHRLRLVAAMALTLAACAIILWQCGYFLVTAASDLQAIGLGYYSFNLLSPIMPLGGSLLNGLPLAYATDGQYEGYAYLGAGVLLLLAIAIAAAAFHADRLAQINLVSHLPFVLVLFLLTLLAVSPRVTLGPHTLWTYDERAIGPLAVFRSSGRLIWPAYYIVVLGVLALIARLGRWMPLVLLPAALALQIADLQDPLRRAQEYRSLGFTNPLKSAFWPAAMPHYQTITVLPTALCGAPPPFDIRPFVLLAGRHGAGINAGGVARYDREKARAYCVELGERLRRGTVRAGELVIATDDVAEAYAAAAGASLACSRVDGFNACVAPASAAAWRDAVPPSDADQTPPAGSGRPPAVR